MAEPLTSVVLPIHNQADHIRGVVRGFLDVVRRMSNNAEIVLVTNACRDESVAICEDLAAQDESVTSVDLREGGWGRAVKAGLAASRGDVLCYTNSARTTPEMLALSLAYSAAYPDVVVKANRKVRDSWWRRLGSLLYNLECRALFDLPTWDINGTPKVFPRKFQKLLSLSEDGDLIDVEFNWICRQEGYPVVEVPLLATVRHGGESTTNYRSALRMYWGAWRLHRSTQSR